MKQLCRKYTDYHDYNCIIKNIKYSKDIRRRERMSLSNRIKVMERRLDFLERKCLQNNENTLLHVMVDRYDHESVI